MAQNYASKFAEKVDERFHHESQASLVINHDYRFTGVKTVNVYSIPVVAMNDYTRTGANRYGTPEDLGTNVQTLTVDKDRGWTAIIDKGDKIQSQMVLEAGKALSRQLREVVVPEYDKHVFGVIAKAAFDKGYTSATACTTSNAYSEFLAAQEHLGNKNVPMKGRVALCTYGYANLLKQDPAFMRYGDRSQEMLVKGIIGEVDGTKIVLVPADRLPEGCDFILTHPMACVAPKQLSEYKIHSDPPGISGWLLEGRIIYGAFVLNNKADAIFYHGTALTEEPGENGETGETGETEVPEETGT